MSRSHLNNHLRSADGPLSKDVHKPCRSTAASLRLWRDLQKLILNAQKLCVFIVENN